MGDDDDPLDPAEREIMSFMLQNSNMSPREVAERFGFSKDLVHSILRRDLRWVMSGR